MLLFFPLITWQLPCWQGNNNLVLLILLVSSILFRGFYPHSTTARFIFGNLEHIQIPRILSRILLLWRLPRALFLILEPAPSEKQPGPLGQLDTFPPQQSVEVLESYGLGTGA